MKTIDESTDPLEIIDQMLDAAKKELPVMVLKEEVACLKFKAILSNVGLVYKRRLFSYGKLIRRREDSFSFIPSEKPSAALLSKHGLSKLSGFHLDHYGKQWYLERTITYYSTEFWESPGK